MGALYVIAGIAGLVWIAFAGYMAYRHRGDKAKYKMWLALAGIGLIPVVLSILRPGDKGDVSVIEVEPHKRTKAPTADEQAKLDAEAGIVEEKADDLREQGEKLDKEAEELDEKRAAAEAEADKLDEDIAATEEPSDDGAGDAGPREPDPRISDRLRGGG